jgi:hypothetical protein
MWTIGMVVRTDAPVVDARVRCRVPGRLEPGDSGRRQRKTASDAKIT